MGAYPNPGLCASGCSLRGARCHLAWVVPRPGLLRVGWVLRLQPLWPPACLPRCAALTLLPAPLGRVMTPQVVGSLLAELRACAHADRWSLRVAVVLRVAGVGSTTVLCSMLYYVSLISRLSPVLSVPSVYLPFRSSVPALLSRCPHPATTFLTVCHHPAVLHHIFGPALGGLSVLLTPS